MSPSSNPAGRIRPEIGAVDPAELRVRRAGQRRELEPLDRRPGSRPRAGARAVVRCARARPRVRAAATPRRGLPGHRAQVLLVAPDSAWSSSRFSFPPSLTSASSNHSCSSPDASRRCARHAGFDIPRARMHRRCGLGSSATECNWTPTWSSSRGRSGRADLPGQLRSAESRDPTPLTARAAPPCVARGPSASSRSS